ncbi:MAG TPA: DNA adenine methylase [Verrucomicrobiae bacterium]|nr:DNA adenine methylase [Verrucomicrobiae bacterium]
MTQIDLIPKRPALRYHGGKWMLAPWLISLFPPHTVYVEPFGGAASVLLRKPRSRIEVYNDLDREVVELFEILRDPLAAVELIRLLELTPFGREEFERAYAPAETPLERSRRLIVRSFSGFGSHSHNAQNSNGFRWHPSKSYAQEFSNLPHGLQAIVQRLHGVTIENQHALKLIPQQDTPDTFFFVDPPYPHSTRDPHLKGYQFEMQDGEHRLLADSLKRIRGKALVCGYAGLYDELFAGWYREEKNSYANGQKGRSERTEVVWANYELPKA